MKTSKSITVFTFLVLTLVACKKDNDQSIVGNGTQLTNFFSSNIETGKQLFTINVGTGGTIIGSKGTKVYIAPNSIFSLEGNPITGNVQLELVEIYDRATMVMMNKPTMGELPNGNRSTLISGGEYYLKITQNGQEVLAPTGVYVSIPTDNTGGLDLEMSLFDLAIEANDQWWNLVADTVAVGDDSTQGTWTTTYEILDGNWGWTNVDRFYDDPRPKTVLKAQLPDGYNNTNCEVYLTYDGEQTALASLDTYTSDGYFSEHYGLIPIGLEVHFIAVTMIDNQLHYAVQGATITNGHIEQITAFAPITQVELAVLINALP
jgi:hypothetical protein